MTAAQWERTVETMGPRLFRYFKFKGAGEHAGDLTQETFLRLLRTEARYDAARGPLIAFALGLAQNIWREHVRKVAPSAWLQELSDEMEPVFDFSRELDERDEVQSLRRSLARLPKVLQDILYLYFDEEMTTREIGVVLAMPEGTVKSHLHRAKKILHETMTTEAR